MCLGFTTRLAYSQNLVVTASQTNATTNDIITFYATFYDQNSGCIDDGSVIWNFGTGAEIIDGAGSGMVQVRYTSAGTRRVSANINVNCNGGRPNRLGSTVTVNITQATVTIAGQAKTEGGIGVANATITAGTNTTTTNAGGYYSLAVPQGFTGSISITHPNYDFTPSSVPLNGVNANLTHNFVRIQPYFCEWTPYSPTCQGTPTGTPTIYYQLCAIRGTCFIWRFTYPNGQFQDIPYGIPIWEQKGRLCGDNRFASVCVKLCNTDEWFCVSY
jgi:hypothetical protein